MIKTKIVETTEKYDKDGKLIEKIVRKETTEDDETTLPFYPNITAIKGCPPDPSGMTYLSNIRKENINNG